VASPPAYRLRQIAGADSVIKTVLFYFYERAWAQVPWGKNAKVVE
jgi:uncharacterized membrane protein